MAAVAGSHPIELGTVRRQIVFDDGSDVVPPAEVARLNVLADRWLDAAVLDWQRGRVWPSITIVDHAAAPDAAGPGTPRTAAVTAVLLNRLSESLLPVEGVDPATVEQSVVERNNAATALLLQHATDPGLITEQHGADPSVDGQTVEITMARPGPAPVLQTGPVWREPGPPAVEITDPLREFEWSDRRADAPVGRGTDEYFRAIREALFGPTRMAAFHGVVSLEVRRIEVRPGRWVLELTVPMILTGRPDAVQQVADRANIAVDGMYNHRYRLPDGDQLHVRLDFRPEPVGAPHAGEFLTSNGAVPDGTLFDSTLFDDSLFDGAAFDTTMFDDVFDGTVPDGTAPDNAVIDTAMLDASFDEAMNGALPDPAALFGPAYTSRAGVPPTIEIDEQYMGRAAQHTWAPGSSGAVLAHEVGHFLGLHDRYRANFALGGVHDPAGHMGSGMFTGRALLREQELQAIQDVVRATVPVHDHPLTAEQAAAARPDPDSLAHRFDQGDPDVVRGRTPTGEQVLIDVATVRSNATGAASGTDGSAPTAVSFLPVPFLPQTLDGAGHPLSELFHTVPGGTEPLRRTPGESETPPWTVDPSSSPLVLEVDFDGGFRVLADPVTTDRGPLPVGTEVVLDGESFARAVVRSTAFRGADSGTEGQPMVVLPFDAGSAHAEMQNFVRAMYPFQRVTYVPDDNLVTGTIDGRQVVAVSDDGVWNRFEPGTIDGGLPVPERLVDTELDPFGIAGLDLPPVDVDGLGADPFDFGDPGVDPALPTGTAGEGAPANAATDPDAALTFDDLIDPRAYSDRPDTDTDPDATGPVNGEDRGQSSPPAERSQGYPRPQQPPAPVPATQDAITAEPVGRPRVPGAAEWASPNRAWEHLLDRTDLVLERDPSGRSVVLHGVQEALRSWTNDPDATGARLERELPALHHHLSERGGRGLGT
ncbi:MAG: hypothetical protein ABW212_16995, partial [Pseudonocardia sediminis]